ncbi:hypothetical protein QR680_002484 [Steinernema hermaphroditum]|uniref:Hikeshi-like domain-containing protein n=1 Tax=Steinernema hermaphroditum TaxID=289476 RepID=A0AA39H2W3_9BILA|nr:hypothetical protein QR680_002484 [Steinernema hermaphroditum]
MSEGPVFGVIAAGRAVETNCTRVSDTEFLFELPQASTINHIVIFLTGAVSLPNEYGASVYARWPQMDGGDGHGDWHFLGALTNNKPSAMFRFGQCFGWKCPARNTNYAGGRTTAEVHNQDADKSAPTQSVEVVPIRVVEEWFNKFQHRLKMNPDFWKYC